MSIQTYCYNIVIPIERLPKCSEMKNLKGALDYFTKTNKIRSVWHDDHLITIGGIMFPKDVEMEVVALHKMGFNIFTKIDGKEYWDDLCVVSFVEGTTLPCSWIEVHSDPYNTSYVWLKGTDKGDIVKMPTSEWKVPQKFDTFSMHSYNVNI